MNTSLPDLWAVFFCGYGGDDPTDQSCEPSFMEDGVLYTRPIAQIRAMESNNSALNFGNIPRPGNDFIYEARPATPEMIAAHIEELSAWEHRKQQQQELTSAIAGLTMEQMAAVLKYIHELRS